MFVCKTVKQMLCIIHELHLVKSNGHWLQISRTINNLMVERRLTCSSKSAINLSIKTARRWEKVQYSQNHIPSSDSCWLMLKFNKLKHDCLGGGVLIRIYQWLKCYISDHICVFLFSPIIFRSLRVESWNETNTSIFRYSEKILCLQFCWKTMEQKELVMFHSQNWFLSYSFTLVHITLIFVWKKDGISAWCGWYPGESGFCGFLPL